MPPAKRRPLPSSIARQRCSDVAPPLAARVAQSAGRSCPVSGFLKPDPRHVNHSRIAASSASSAASGLQSPLIRHEKQMLLRPLIFGLELQLAPGTRRNQFLAQGPDPPTLEVKLAP